MLALISDYAVHILMLKAFHYYGDRIFVAAHCECFICD